MITIILLTFLSMTVLLMGFMDIRLPFVTDGSQNHNLSSKTNIRDITQPQSRPASQKKSNQYIHYTSAENRGIFPDKSVEYKVHAESSCLL